MNDWQVGLWRFDSGKHVAEEVCRFGSLFEGESRSCVISSKGSHRSAVKINTQTEERLSNNWQVDLLKLDSGKHVAEEDWRTGSLFREKKRTCVSHRKEVIDLLSRSMHEWRRGFRMIGKLTCQNWIAANTSLKRFADLVHYLKERAGVVLSHQKEVIDLLSRSMHKWRRGFQFDLSRLDSSKHITEEDWRTGSLFGEKKRTCVISSKGSY